MIRFPFLIRNERNIKRNSQRFPFSQNGMKYKELLLKHAFFSLKHALGLIEQENHFYYFSCLKPKNEAWHFLAFLTLSNEISISIHLVNLRMKLTTPSNS